MSPSKIMIGKILLRKQSGRSAWCALMIFLFGVKIPAAKHPEEAFINNISLFNR